ncbi:hypothetical protein P378_10205 [Desulforamulus profundi]|uniref:Uncharacterized protein n=1 Tax=Desulforamulus profundi TaxID=1383067 RepID=A0A2C6MEY2_9FIRM|nr:DUF4365 domain-containing protein [Desulforamulus profundi]PHJ38194.1 hypothetical protein P378_10205 [Desulforamulus profundi]
MIDSTDSLEKKSNRMVLVSSGIPKPTTPKGHTIFLEALPWSWAVRQIHEPFLHYEVEILDSGTPKGAVFSVYVVCASSLRVNRELIGLSLECDKLKHCMDKACRPVILVVVDADKESAFWLFVQDYVHRVLEKKTPGWRQQKTVSLQVPLDQELTTSLEQLKRTVFYGLEHLYLEHFHRFFQKFNSRISQFFNSPEEMELAVKVESSRHYTKQLLTSPDKCSCSTASNHSCNSCQPPGDGNDGTGESDHKIQASLEKAQNMKVLDPKENRIAYYCISEALDFLETGLRPVYAIRPRVKWSFTITCFTF